MQSSEVCGKRILSDMGQVYHEANSQNQFDEAHETAAQSHPSCCQHSPWGCVRCSSLPFLNSPFQPTEHLISNEIHNSNNMDQIDMQLRAIPAGPARVSRQYATSLLSSPSNQGNLAHQYLSMRGPEQQSTSFRPPVTPTVSHMSTPQSIFSNPRTSPNTGQSPYDWATPATTVSSYFKGHSTIHASNNQSELYRAPSTIGGKISDDFNVQFVLDAGNDNQQWLQDAESDDLSYRRGSQSAAVQLQDQKQLFESAEVIDFMAPEDFRVLNNERQVRSQTCMQPVYDGKELYLGQRYLPVDQKVFNIADLEFNNPFSPTNVINPYETQTVYGQLDAYDALDFNAPFYQNVGYPPPLAVTPSNDLAVQGNGKQSRVGQSRPRHNGRDEDLDRKLVEWRDAGMSYKEIMARGNFGLEESTLRGRYRTLTKSKEKRLRKPLWDEHAVSLNAILQDIANTLSRSVLSSKL